MSNQDPLLQALHQTRSHLRDIDSVRPQVDNRIAILSPAPPFFTAKKIPLLLLLLPLLYLTRSHTPTPPPLSENLVVTTGNAQLIEHLSTLTPHHNVLIAWSFQGLGVTTDYADSRIGHYLRHTLRKQPTPDGRTLVWSLFTPDPGTLPSLQPPSISATLSNHTLLELTASLQPLSPNDTKNLPQNID